MFAFFVSDVKGNCRGKTDRSLEIRASLEVPGTPCTGYWHDKKTQVPAKAVIRLLEQLKVFWLEPAVIYDGRCFDGVRPRVVAGIFRKPSLSRSSRSPDHLAAYRDKMAANQPAHPNFTLHQDRPGARQCHSGTWPLRQWCLQHLIARLSA